MGADTGLGIGRGQSGETYSPVRNPGESSREGPRRRLMDMAVPPPALVWQPSGIALTRPRPPPADKIWALTCSNPSESIVVDNSAKYS